jgi:diaminopimelate epimerase
MRFSRWQAQGNVYLVAEERLTADAVRAAVGDADGILEVTARGRDWLEIAIWNPDGSLAEMSGNGTRIAACWLAAQTAADIVTVRVGEREVVARMLAPPFVEQRLPYKVGEPGASAGVRFIPVDVGNPHAVVEADLAELPRLGPQIENDPQFPNRTNVQVAQRIDDQTIAARVWERGVGETASSGTSAIAVAAAFGANDTRIRFAGGDLHVRLDGEFAYLTGTAERSTWTGSTP